MFDFYLLFKGDIIFVSILTVLYLFYSYANNTKSDKIIKSTIIFIFSFYLVFFFLNLYFNFSSYDIRGIAKIIIIPTVLIYLLIVIKRNNYIRRIIIWSIIFYIVFWLVLIIAHGISNM